MHVATGPLWSHCRAPHSASERHAGTHKPCSAAVAAGAVNVSAEYVAQATSVRPAHSVLEDRVLQVATHTPKVEPATSRQSPARSKSVQSAEPRQAEVQYPPAAPPVAPGPFSYSAQQIKLLPHSELLRQAAPSTLGRREGTRIPTAGH